MTPQERWIALWRSFPVLEGARDVSTGARIEPGRDGLRALDEWAGWSVNRSSGAGTQAALFILDLWDASRCWRAGHFDLFAAISVWDDRQMAAFQSWAKDPFRP